MEPTRGAQTEIKDKLFLLVHVEKRHTRESLHLRRYELVLLMTMVMAQERKCTVKKWIWRLRDCSSVMLGLFVQKRVFQRDKKGRICTTLVPSCFVLDGFIIFLEGILNPLSSSTTKRLNIPGLLSFSTIR